MEEMALRLEQKKESRRRAKRRDQTKVAWDSNELLESFPLPQYFQVHFSHVHKNLEETSRQIDELRRSIIRLEQKLDRLLALMTENET
jgi:hypothetical protein